MSRIVLFVCGVLALIMLAVSIDTADAARFGGGRSFGGRSFMTRPAQPPSAFTQQRQQAFQNPSAAATAQRPGMGIFGGLLAGTLLGSMLFGEGGMNGLFSLIIIGGLVYLAFRLLAGLRRAGQARGRAGYDNARETSSPFSRRTQYQTSPPAPDGSTWDMLRGTGVSSSPAPGTVPPASDRVHVPGDFDTAEFLKGAKAAYTRLNASWDKRNLDDIAEFSTPAFMAVIREQAAADPNPGRTDILLINADLVDVREDSGEQLASVFFNVVLREDVNSAPVDVREVWHFARGADGSGMWKLDGIQQVQY